MTERITFHEIETRREFGLGLICDMGDLALAMVQLADIGVQIKPDGSKVTKIDIEINEQMIKRFGEHFPEDLIWGEEGANGPVGREFSDEYWTWVADSIDSTGNMVRTHERVMWSDVPDFSRCRSTILLSGFAPGDRAPSTSLIHSPFLPGRPTLYATPEGVWLKDADGTRQVQLAGDVPRSLGEVELFDCVSWREAHPNFRDLLEAELPGRRVDRRLSMGAVALQAVDLSIFPGPLSNPHDVAAGAHIGHMAGAAVRTLDGRRFEEVDWLHGPINGVVVAASDELAKEVVQQHRLMRVA